MAYTPHWSAVWQARDALLEGAQITLEITVVSMAAGTAIGVFLALARRSDNRVLSSAATAWIEVARNTPCLFQIYMAYFGLGSFGIHLSSYAAVLAALIFNNAGYMAEIIRGGLLSIPKGQSESAAALGMTYFQLMRRIVLPQVVRVIIPPITNDAATTLKNTSLLSTITIMELMLQTQVIVSSTFRPFEFYILVSLIYLVMTTVLMVLLRWAERHYQVAY